MPIDCLLAILGCSLLFLLTLQDMIHIADTKVARRYGDFFIRQIHKFEEVSCAGEEYGISRALRGEVENTCPFIQTCFSCHLSGKWEDDEMGKVISCSKLNLL